MVFIRKYEYELDIVSQRYMLEKNSNLTNEFNIFDASRLGPLKLSARQ